MEKANLASKILQTDENDQEVDSIHAGSNNYLYTLCKNFPAFHGEDL